MTVSTRALPQLSPEQSQSLAAAAGRLIKLAAFDRSTQLAPADLFGSDLAELAAVPVAGVFVTAKRNGQLRSCCGNIGQVQPLGQALTQAAIRTATDDPRFPPISPNELRFLDLDVWLLGPPEVISENGEDRIGAVTIGKHGLQVVRGGQRGLLLPGVATENGWDAEEFLNRTCMKAGMSPTAWRDDETQVFRFEGSEHIGKVLAENEEIPPMPPLFSPRDIAAYSQFCGQTLRTIMQGATPLYYCPSVSDGNVNGVSLRAGISGTTNDLTVTRLNLKHTMPLQATMFSMCEELARVLAQNKVPAGEVQISMSVLMDPNMHGTVEKPDLRGIEAGQRAMLVIEGNHKVWVFDDDESPEELLKEASKLLKVNDPTISLVMSLQVASSRSRGQVVDRPQAVSGPAIRPPAVAGTFYPGTAEDIRSMVDELLPENVTPERIPAAMVPHAGWKYSGQVAMDVLARLQFPKTVIVLSPKHTPHGVDWAVAPMARWSLPNGEIDSDQELAKKLAERITGLELDAAAHHKEHGIEVELPMIRELAPGTKVVGITIGGGTLDRLTTFAEELAGVIREMDEPPLLLISSDMNHFANDEETRRLDEMALVELDKLDADGLFETTTTNHISMCGMRPAVIVVKALQHLQKLTKAEQIGYATTADVTGDKTRVVGYAGMLFF